MAIAVPLALMVFHMINLVWSAPGNTELQARAGGVSTRASDVVVITTVSQSTYSLTYRPPTATGTASPASGWGFIPPIASLPFPVPPLIPPPEIAPIPSQISGSTTTNTVIITTVSQSTYSLTYQPPTATGTASTTSGWGFIPPVAPLPFPVPPNIPPPAILPLPSQTAGSTTSDVVIITSVSQSTYSLTYRPPTGTGTASTTSSWSLVPPIVPLPFPAPPALPPPEDPEEDEPEPSITTKPSESATSCSTQTAVVGVVNCTEIVWASSCQLQSSLGGCSTSTSSTLGCSVTSSTTTNTIYPDFPEPTSAPDEPDISHDPGKITFDPLPRDVNRVARIFYEELGMEEPLPEPTPGDLKCSPSDSDGPSFIQDNALDNVMDFCRGGISIQGDGSTKSYPQPGNKAIELEISTEYAESDACSAGQTAKWAEDRCKYLINRPIFDCEKDNDHTQIAKFGGNITADCATATVTPKTTQKVVCGPFDNGSGMGYHAFSAEEANDAIDKYCNSKEGYTLIPDQDIAPNGDMKPVSKDRFWYKKGVYCSTTSPHAPVPNVPKDQSICKKGKNDVEITIQVRFKDNQDGCQPRKTFEVPKGDECVNIFRRVSSTCPLDNVPHNGGKVDDESDSGCLEWWVYGMNPQF